MRTCQPCDWSDHLINFHGTSFAPLYRMSCRLLDVSTATGSSAETKSMSIALGGIGILAALVLAYALLPAG